MLHSLSQTLSHAGQSPCSLQGRGGKQTQLLTSTDFAKPQAWNLISP